MNNDLMSEIFKINEPEVEKYYKQRNADIEFILRNKIYKPIKGEITKNKLRWRGIKSICFGADHTFIGILQRGKVITRNGVYEPITYPKVETKLKFEI